MKYVSAVKRYGTRILVVLLVACILAAHPIGSNDKVPRVEAGFALETTQIQNTIAGTQSALMDTSLTLGKEMVGLDQIAYMITKLMLSTMIRSITNWVNSGFNGAPTFVTDLKQHLLNVADTAAAEFLFSEDGLGLTALETLCSPFALDVQFAVTQSVASNLSEREDGYQAQCTLSDIAGNVQNFMQGDFASGGGWQNWVQMSQQPDMNTAFGAQMTAESALMRMMNEQESNERLTLNFGNGFLSMKDEDGNITTPGDVIAGQINKALGAGQDVLVEADEINELLTALFYQLVNQLFTPGGLRGSNYGDGFDYDNIQNGGNVDLDDIYTPIDPDDIGGDPPDLPGFPTEPSVDPVDPFTDEPLDPTIPGTEDPSVDPVDGDIDDVGGELPSEDPVGGSATTTDPTDPTDPVGGGGGGGGGVDPV